MAAAYTSRFPGNSALYRCTFVGALVLAILTPLNHEVRVSTLSGQLPGPPQALVRPPGEVLLERCMRLQGSEWEATEQALSEWAANDKRWAGLSIRVVNREGDLGCHVRG